MPFSRPTLTELVTRIGADMLARLETTGPLARRAVTKILATVWAGAAHLLHGHLAWLAEQLFAQTAERESLIKLASLYGLVPTAATFATGTVLATGQDDTEIPLGTIVVRDDGVQFQVTGVDDAIIASGEASIPVIAILAGALANTETDDVLTFQSPIDGVDADVTVEDPGLAGGNDEEDTEAFRARYLLARRTPPQGGADQDYVAWALAVAGVTRAWVFPLEDGPGTVTVRFVRDEDVSIFPDSGEVATVQDYIDEKRPVTADVTVAAPVALSLTPTISITPDTPAIRAAVEAELTDLLIRDAEPGDGAGAGTIYLSRLQVAIGTASGVEDFTLTSPSADVVPDLGELVVLGTITWS